MAERGGMRITADIKNWSPKDKEAYFEEFNKTMNKMTGLKDILQIRKVDTNVREANTGKTEGYEGMNANNVTFVVRKNITNPDEIISILKSLSKWAENMKKEGNKPSVEVLVDFIKFPLYYRKGKYIPPDTYYHRHMITKEQHELIESLNNALK